jgi:transcriptional regulator with XRE-family HTH domain
MESNPDTFPLLRHLQLARDRSEKACPKVSVDEWSTLSDYMEAMNAQAESMNVEGRPQSRRAKAVLREELGRRIAEARQRRRWSQTKLAQRLEVPRDRVGRWERGVNAPSLDDLAALSEVLEVSLEELGLGRPPREPISSGDLAELISHFSAMTRLLKPWLAAKKR